VSRAVLAFSFVACVVQAGCAATYTSIRRADDGTYFITRTKQNAFTAWGTLHHCTASADGSAMQCETIAEP
jgi:hypothetical protein